MPRKRCTPVLSPGRGMLVMADALDGSGSRRLSVYPIKVTDVALSCNFFAGRRKS